MEQPTDHQRNVRKAMEGNIAAYFHTHEERIAFLYPNGRINIFDSQTFENVETMNIPTTKPEGGLRSNQELIERADVKMAIRRFDRQGRVQEARAFPN